MLLSIIFLPLYSFLCVSFFGRYLGRLGSIQVTIINMLIVFFLSLRLFLNLSTGNSFVYITLGPWITTGLIQVN